MPTESARRHTGGIHAGAPRVASRAKRRAWIVVTGALVLAGCGGDGPRGLAEARGVGGNLCRALEAFASSYRGPPLSESDLAALRRNSQAVVEVIPPDAPGEVTAFFAGLAEMVELSQVWENPETGGIKEEYVDDFTRLLGATTGDAAATTESYLVDQCQARPGSGLSELFTGGDGPLPSPSGGGDPSASAPSGPAEVVTVLSDGPAGVYEQVTLDIATVTATNAEPTDAYSDDPRATASSSLLVEIDLTTDESSPNQFSAEDFRLTDPSGGTIAAQSVIDRGGNSAPLQLRGRDSARGIVVFPTGSLVRDPGGYALHIDRDDQVPTVLPLSGALASPYPIELEAGASGAFEAALTPTCLDRYETSVSSASADLDADLGDPSGIERVARGERWVRLVLDVTNVTVSGPSSTDGVCFAFSGNFAGVELRLDADGRLTAAENEKSFDRIEPGTTSERVQVFPVAADARALVLVGPAGETLGQWTVDFPGSPGEG